MSEDTPKVVPLHRNAPARLALQDLPLSRTLADFVDVARLVRQAADPIAKVQHLRALTAVRIPAASPGGAFGLCAVRQALIEELVFDLVPNPPERVAKLLTALAQTLQSLAIARAHAARSQPEPL